MQRKTKVENAVSILFTREQIIEAVKFGYYTVIQFYEEISMIASKISNLSVGTCLLKLSQFGKAVVVELEKLGITIRANKFNQSCTVAIAGLMIMLLFLQAAVVVSVLRHRSISSSNTIHSQEVSFQDKKLEDERFEATMKKVNPIAKTKAIGITRVKATDEQLKIREKQYIETQQFTVLKTDPKMEAPERISQYRGIIESSAKQHGVDADTLEAILTLESHGKTSDQSPTGPRGIAMFAKARAQEAGLSTAPGNDERLDPNKAIPAAAWSLRDAYDRRYGDWDFAVAEHHMGQGALPKLIEMYLKPRPDKGSLKKNIEYYNVKYRDVFFRNAPNYNPGTYQMLRKLTDKDWSPRYFFKVESWKQLLKLYRQDKAAYVELSKQQFYKGKAKSSAMWSFFNRMNDTKLSDVGTIRKEISNGNFVQLITEQNLGYKVRSLGKSDPKLENRPYYYYVKVPTAGMTLYLGEAYKQLRASKGYESAQFEISSVTRTVKYQKRLTKTNRFATKDESFHTYGLAIDIPYSSLPEKGAKQDLEFILEDLYQAGMISWVRENNNCYHVVVSPDEEARKIFSDFYHQHQSGVKTEIDLSDDNPEVETDTLLEETAEEVINEDQSGDDNSNQVPTTSGKLVGEIIQGQLGASITDLESKDNSPSNKAESKESVSVETPKVQPSPTPKKSEPKKSDNPKRNKDNGRDPFKKPQPPLATTNVSRDWV